MTESDVSQRTEVGARGGREDPGGPTARASAVERQRHLWEREASGYDRTMRFWERQVFGDAREWACAHATGDALEVAVGTGSTSGSTRPRSV